MVPPQTLPMPVLASLAGPAHAGFNGFPFAALHSEWPGWLSVYRRAVDNGDVSELNAFAVNAFAMAMPRLPGHVAAMSDVDTARAHSSPSRLTIAPHIAFPWLSPPASPFCDGASCSSFFSASAPGTSSHPFDRGGDADSAGCGSSRCVGPELQATSPARSRAAEKASDRRMPVSRATAVPRH